MRGAFLIFILLLSAITFAEFRQTTKSEKLILNPKEVTEARFRIALSGTLAVAGGVEHINMTLSIPQEGVENVNVIADAWRYITDEYGNRLVLMEWEFPGTTVNYRIETTVTNKAVLAQEKAIGSDMDYLKENDQIRFTPELREIAFPFEKTMKRASELVSWVHDYINYDLSFVGQLKPSDWVYENRRGVCVEYANLLSALLKISGIPTRYVVGYAYSAVEQKLIGHTWVEVLASDGSWVPLDPTWLQAGYLDATHIKTAVRDDANQTEKMSYTGKGAINVLWDRNEDEIELLSHKVADITSIALSVNDITMNEYGIAKAVVSAESCTIAEINITSCVGDERKPVLDILDRERSEWICRSKEIYWAYSAAVLKKGFTYTCPVSVYRSGTLEDTQTVKISEERVINDVQITGPNTVAVSENFVLAASAGDDFIFFSPKLGKSDIKTWSLSIKSPGQYTFYLYSDGALAAKTVQVVEKKEFSVTAAAPRNTSLNSSFILTVTAENLLVAAKTATIRVDFDDKIIERQAVFNPREVKVTEFNLTATKAGTRKISAAALTDVISSYSTSIIVQAPDKPVSIVDSILGAIIGFFSAIIGFFAGLLPK